MPRICNHDLEYRWRRKDRSSAVGAIEAYLKALKLSLKILYKHLYTRYYYYNDNYEYTSFFIVNHRIVSNMSWILLNLSSSTFFACQHLIRYICIVSNNRKRARKKARMKFLVDWYKDVLLSKQIFRMPVT